jgi:energy-coupling factor transporter ATP-binding protein EcfA2
VEDSEAAIWEEDERLAIEAVAVDELHGKFSYDITLAGDDALDDAGLFNLSQDRLTLLYGTNGSGKTSVLRTLFHALSAAPRSGHRRRLLNTRFTRFAVNLTDGTTIAYERSEDDGQGPVTARLERPGAEPVAWTYSGGEKPTYLRADESEEMYLSGAKSGPNSENQFIAGLEALNINPVFLSDARAITADVLDDGVLSVEARRRRAASAERQQSLADRRVADVEDALQRVRLYLSQLVFSGAQAGSQRVDNVYVNVASAIVQHASKPGRPRKGILPDLREQVAALGERAATFHGYGLLPEFPTEALIDQLDRAAQTNGPVLKQVLEPYLTGLTERMDALEPGLTAVASITNVVNAFLGNKRVEFGVGGRRIKITDEDTGGALQAADLSSGEKQIVLLFSDIVALQDRTRLFIIDEPELSLNPDWQRKLMPGLLAVTEESRMQVLAATHSIEIMARYQDRIWRLDQSE